MCGEGLKSCFELETEFGALSAQLQIILRTVGDVTVVLRAVCVRGALSTKWKKIADAK